MNKKTFILFIIVVLTISTHAQEYEKRNLVKFNSFALVFNNSSLFYERAIIPRVTASLGLSYKYKSKPPGLYFENDYASIHMKMDEIRGYAITPEIRYYLKSCETHYPSGFYSGFYYRYTRYKSDLDIRYTDDAGLDYFYTSHGKLDEHGLGIQLGYQLHITNWFFLDFLIIGPRFSFYKINLTFDENINDEFIVDAEKYIQHIIDKFGISYEVDLNEVNFKNMKSKFEFLNWRYGLSIGVSFYHESIYL